MKQIEKITLVAAATVSAGYLVREVLRRRAERLFRLAAGESPYERSHPRIYRAQKYAHQHALAG